MIKVEMKGPENTLRVRQVKVLGWKEGDSIKIPGQISASMAQQKNCEAETLRVFRLITSQVGMFFTLLLFPSDFIFGGQKLNVTPQNTLSTQLKNSYNKIQ